jgi:hypothetical protein
MNDNIVYVIFGSGQSLRGGTEGLPALSTQSIYSRALMLGSSVGSGGEGNVPLPPYQQLQKLKATGNETVDFGWAAHTFAYAPVKLPEIIWCYHGIGGEGYQSMKKGTVAFEKAKAQLSRIVELYSQQGKRVVVACCDWISGENDSAGWYALGANPAATYYRWMREYSADLNAELGKITGQGEQIKLFFCQTQSATFYYQYLSIANGFTAANGYGSLVRPPDYPAIASVQLQLARDFPESFVLVGAKYHFDYATQRSNHLSAQGYRSWGYKRGEVFIREILKGEHWQPFAMKKAFFKLPNVIQIDYDVMPGFGPLVLDPVNISNPGNMGFEFVADGGNQASIASVAIDTISQTSVLITLNKVPTGLNKSITYAWNNADASTYSDIGLQNGLGSLPKSMGRTLGPRGCLRNSNPTNTFGQTMFDWAVHEKRLID